MQHALHVAAGNVYAAMCVRFSVLGASVFQVRELCC